MRIKPIIILALLLLLNQPNKARTQSAQDLLPIDQEVTDNAGLPTSIETILDYPITEQTWRLLQGDLPCLDITESCVNQLQELAVTNSNLVKELDQQISYLANEIRVAKTNNKKAIAWEQFSPFLQYYLGNASSENDGIFGRLGNDGRRPGNLFNNILSLGIPIIRNIFGGNSDAQNRRIAINDLEVKLTELQSNQEQLKQTIRDNIHLDLLEIDKLKQEFILSYDIAQRNKQRLEIIKINYRYGGSDSLTYLSQLSNFDQEKNQVWRNWYNLQTKVMKFQQQL